jgi:hypothetical protein
MHLALKWIILTPKQQSNLGIQSVPPRVYDHPHVVPHDHPFLCHNKIMLISMNSDCTIQFIISQRDDLVSVHFMSMSEQESVSR